MSNEEEREGSHHLFLFFFPPIFFLVWVKRSNDLKQAKEEVPTYNPSPSAPSDSASVWADSKFTDDKRKDKFLQLMGAKKRKTEEEYDPLKPTVIPTLLSSLHSFFTPSSLFLLFFLSTYFFLFSLS